MKKVILFLIIGIAVFLIFIFITGRRDALIMSWNDLAPIKADQIEGYVRIYKTEQGMFPTSLNEMRTNADFSCRADLESVLSHSNNFQFDYKLNSNGYIITVAHPAGQNQDFRKVVRECSLDLASTNNGGKK